MTALQPVFVHGWACGPEIWDAVLAHLEMPHACVVDQGYFSGRSEGPSAVSCLAGLDMNRPILGIGHSLGLMWLLSQRKWPQGSRFVGINAFGRFAAGVDFPEGVAARVLARMQTGLGRDAGAVVNSFRARCGLDAVDPATCHVSALQDGLSLLTTGNVYSQMEQMVAHGSTRMVALAGKQDPIVTERMTEAAFPSNVEKVWHEDGGHMMPLTHPEFCVAHIQRLMTEAV
ncbi:alpha/beta fold hydrolase [Acetobacter tropicalis]|uniref:alpha/beta fold hydrolase n=1 Tax=Acetobacter tropicalis TaxID=104102 RepID=UPI003976AAAA